MSGDESTVPDDADDAPDSVGDAGTEADDGGLSRRQLLGGSLPLGGATAGAFLLLDDADSELAGFMNNLHGAKNHSDDACSEG